MPICANKFVLYVIRNGYRFPFVNDYNQAEEIMAIRNVEIVKSVFNFRGLTIFLHHKCFYSCI